MKRHLRATLAWLLWMETVDLAVDVLDWGLDRRSRRRAHSASEGQ